MTKKTNKLSTNQLSMYILERALYRILHSQYRHYFIVTGDFLIALLNGYQNKKVNQIECIVREIPLKPIILLPIFKKILKRKNPDQIQYQVKKIKKTKPNLIIVTVDAQVENQQIQFRFHLTKEKTNIQRIKVTDQQKNTFPFLAVPQEHLLAQKVEDIFTHPIGNHKIQNFYDIYLFTKKTINHQAFIQCIQKILKKKKTTYLLEELEFRYSIISKNQQLKKQWEKYQLENNINQEITYEKLMACLKKVIQKINNLSKIEK